MFANGTQTYRYKAHWDKGEYRKGVQACEWLLLVHVILLFLDKAIPIKRSLIIWYQPKFTPFMGNLEMTQL